MGEGGPPQGADEFLGQAGAQQAGGVLAVGEHAVEVLVVPLADRRLRSRGLRLVRCVIVSHEPDGDRSPSQRRRQALRSCRVVGAGRLLVADRVQVQGIGTYILPVVPTDSNISLSLGAEEKSACSNSDPYVNISGLHAILNPLPRSRCRFLHCRDSSIASQNLRILGI